MKKEKMGIKKFGLIGYPLKHSLSPVIQRHIMEKCAINGIYELYEVSPEKFDNEIHELMALLDGFNLTIPYKERIIPYLASLRGEARVFKTVNTVTDNWGYSTDIIGLLESGIPFKGSRVLILGAGGAARAVLVAAGESGCSGIGIWARRIEQAQKLKDEYIKLDKGMNILVEPLVNVGPDDTELFKSRGLKYDIIINATPAGMWPECGQAPVCDELIMAAGYVYDTIYNPLATRLVLKSRSFGVKADSGLTMLIGQAAAAQKIWNPEADFSDFSPLILQQELKYKLLQDFPIKIVLTGFMGCGKSTVGKILAESLDIGFRDLDALIEEKNGMPVRDIFASYGEPFFRKSESECLTEVMDEDASLVVAAGGGALLNELNLETVRSRKGFTVYLNADIDTVIERTSNSTDRPLLKDRTIDQITELYRKRSPVYVRSSDFVTDASKEVNEVVQAIKTAFGF